MFIKAHLKKVIASVSALVIAAVVLVVFAMPVGAVSYSEGEVAISLGTNISAEPRLYDEPYTTKIETNKYVINYSGEEVYVGKGTDIFVPEIILYRFGEECSVILGEPLVNNEPLSQKNAGSVLTADVIQWASKDIQFNFYPVKIDSQNELGSFEYDMTIANSKAGTDTILSSISFPMTSEGLNFYYQPPLTQEEIDAGTFRPENVEGSYAVYHSTKRDHIIGQTNYGTGKAFHIYRPMLVDNVGDIAYADIIITEGWLTIDYSNIQAWLNKAKYPVSQVAGLNFGYTGTGNTDDYPPANMLLGSVGTSPATANMLGISMSAYGYGGLSTNYKLGIWANADNGALLTNALTPAIDPDTILGWDTGTFATQPDIAQSTAYMLCHINDDGEFVIKLDNTTGSLRQDWSNSYASPGIFDWDSDEFEFTYSVYVTYEEAGGEPDIALDPGDDAYDFGSVGVSETPVSGLTEFTVTNNSGAAVTITIKAIDWTGGDGWTQSDDGAAGNNIAGLKAGLSGGDYTIIVKKNAAYNNLVAGLADEATQDFGLKLYAPTVFSDGVEKETTVTLTATLD